MSLADMMKCDEDALICDLAETYHIFDIRALPLEKVALFSVGLRDNSRIKMKMANVKYQSKEIMLMSIIDHLSILVWQNTKDAIKGKNKPNSLMDKLLNVSRESEISSFNSGYEFEKARNEILKKGE